MDLAPLRARRRSLPRRELGSSYCMLAHGKVLAERFYDAEHRASRSPLEPPGSRTRRGRRGRDGPRARRSRPTRTPSTPDGHRTAPRARPRRRRHLRRRGRGRCALLLQQDRSTRSAPSRTAPIGALEPRRSEEQLTVGTADRGVQLTLRSRAAAHAAVHDARQHEVERHEEGCAEDRLQRVRADRVLALVDDVDQGGQHDEDERRALERALQRRRRDGLALGRRAARLRLLGRRPLGAGLALVARHGLGVCDPVAPLSLLASFGHARTVPGCGSRRVRSRRPAHPSSAHSPSQKTCFTRGVPRW